MSWPNGGGLVFPSSSRRVCVEISMSRNNNDTNTFITSGEFTSIRGLRLWEPLNATLFSLNTMIILILSKLNCFPQILSLNFGIHMTIMIRCKTYFGSVYCTYFRYF